MESTMDAKLDNMMVAVKVAAKVVLWILHLALQWVAMLEWLTAAAKACCWVATTVASLDD